MTKARNLSLLSTVEVGATADQTKSDIDALGIAADITAGDTAARAGRKNLIINGSAMVSQRGSYTSATTIQNASYFLDRFRFQNSVVTGTVQHTSISLNGVNKKAIKVAATSTGTGYLILQQTVEFQSIQVGENYTVSCWVRSNNANTRFRQNTFRATSEDGTAFTNDGNWEKVSWTFSSTGTTGSPTINIAMYNNANVSISNGDYFEITELQLETGSVATDFEHRSYGEELQLCQRYFEIPYFGNTAASRWSGADWVGSVSFAVTKRVVPTMSFSGLLKVWGDGSVADATLFTNWDINVTGFGLRAQGGHGNAAAVFYGQSTAVCKADAEL